MSEDTNYPKVSKKSLENLKPAKKGEPSRNPLGVSKFKAELRSQAEHFFGERGITKYLEKLDKLAMQNQSPKVALGAISEILDRCLGKNFTLDLGDTTSEVMNALAKLLNSAHNGNGKSD